MKKHNLFKVIGIVILITLLLTWILPTSYYQYSLVSDGTRSQVGLFDLLSYPTMSLSYFGNVIIFILAVGGFYGVLNKIGAYRTLLEKIVKGAKGKESIVLTIIMILIAVLTSVSGASMGILVIVPFIISLVLLMGYNKITAAMVTVGAIAVGMIGNTFSSTYVIDEAAYSLLAQNGMGVVNSILSTTAKDQIVAKIIMLIVGIALLVVNTLIYAKKNKTEQNVSDDVLGATKNDEVLSTAKKDSKKKESTIVWKKDIVASVILCFVTLGIYELVWYYKIVCDTQKISKQNELPKPWKVMILTIVTLGFYSWYVYYKIGKMLSNNDKKENKSVLYLILAIVAPVVANIVIQHKLNEYGKEPIEELDNEDITKKYYTKKSIIPIVVIVDLIFVIVILSQISWTSVFGVNLFTDITTAVSNFKIGGFPVFAKILGTIGAFEQWTLEHMTVLLLLGSGLLALIYRVKFNDFINGVVVGAKKALKPAVLVALIYIVLVIVNMHPITLTIAKPLVSKFNVFASSLAAFIASVLNVDLYYAASNVLPYAVSVITDSSVYSIIALIWQAMYGFVALVAPTSVLLITILSYLDISYGKWIKSNKVFIFGVLLLVLIVPTMLVIFA